MTRNSAWLLFSARVRQFQRDRELLACVDGRMRRLVPSRAAPTRSGAMPVDPRKAGRWAALSDGRLFKVSGLSVERRGTGHPCVVCGQVIELPNPEREVEEDGRVAVAHDDCYRLWREECQSVTSKVRFDHAERGS
jgi:hypothetical protein